jgi:hypothetical protein
MRSNDENRVTQLPLWQEKQSKYLQMSARKHAWLLRQPERERQAEQKRLRRMLSLRHAMTQSCQQREQWYSQQPPHRCSTCGQIKPASDFGGVCNAYGFFPHSQCTNCHQALRTHHQLACCLCQKKVLQRDFLSQYDGYALCGNGSWVPLCCQGCEAAFLALPTSQQRLMIQACCQRTFPSGQIIYAEVDPETDDIRYVGRTGDPKRRHTQHLRDASLTTGQWWSERMAWYTRKNWIQALHSKGLEPVMKILQTVELSPLVVEWEQRYIWNGLRRGWGLLNVEAMDEALGARVKAAQVDFLTASFETLVEQGFFTAYGIEAFLHAYAQ